MAAYYLDTSALVKRYAREVGSVWLVNLTRPSAGNEIFTVLATGPEMIAAIFRKVRTGQASQMEAVQAATTFRGEWLTQYQLVPFTNTLADEAMGLVEKHGLRGYDSIHLAAALTIRVVRQVANLSALTFVSSDRAQLQAARAEGLAAEDPTAFP